LAGEGIVRHVTPFRRTRCPIAFGIAPWNALAETSVCTRAPIVKEVFYGTQYDYTVVR
jgi:hypothetical protein